MKQIREKNVLQVQTGKNLTLPGITAVGCVKNLAEERAYPPVIIVDENGDVVFKKTGYRNRGDLKKIMEAL